MSPADQKLLQEAQQFAKNFISTKLDKAYTFHNMDHTYDVVKACEMMVNEVEVNDTEKLCLFLAAWFHDTGYANGSYQHEESSQKIAASFLTGKGIDNEIINMVNACIMATKMPQSPANTIEQILCDADLFHLGTENFTEKTKLLRQEINNLQDRELDKKEWRQMNVEFLERHRYFTDFAKENLEPVKQQHLQQLLEKLGRKERQAVAEKIGEPNIMVSPLEPEPEEADEKSVDKPKEKDKDKGGKKKEGRSERGTVAMFRIMSENHVNLSQMADSKANIMISVNTIVLSIMVSLLLGKLQFYPEYIVPTIILVVVCLSAVIFAILATRPNISGGTFTKEDIQNKQINLLFFGNFFKVELPDYDWAMKEMMNDKEYLFGSMIKDIYFLGKVLARKYRLIRISYNIFMFGLVISIIAFGLAFVLSANTSGQ
jgi:predicted metal-dependent HD superfamily phosphohydrolase